MVGMGDGVWRVSFTCWGSIFMELKNPSSLQSHTGLLPLASLLPQERGSVCGCVAHAWPFGGK